MSDTYGSELANPAMGKTWTGEVGLQLRKWGAILAKPLKKVKKQSRQGKYDTLFPLPQDVQNFAKTLKTDQVNFQTNLSLGDIAQFYRRELTSQGLAEIELVTLVADDCISLAFAGLPDDKKVIVQAVDLGYSSNVDMRNVNLRTEGGGESPERPRHPRATVNANTIDIVLGMTGVALEKAGYTDALKLVKDSFAAECTVCGVKISGEAMLSEQRQLLREYAKEGVVLYRGPDALAWENLDKNKCVKPGCNSTTYRLTWMDSETRHIFNSVLSRFDQV